MVSAGWAGAADSAPFHLKSRVFFVDFAEEVECAPYFHNLGSCYTGIVGWHVLFLHNSSILSLDCSSFFEEVDSLWGYAVGLPFLSGGLAFHQIFWSASP